MSSRGRAGTSTAIAYKAVSSLPGFFWNTILAKVVSYSWSNIPDKPMNKVCSVRIIHNQGQAYSSRGHTTDSKDWVNIVTTVSSLTILLGNDTIMAKSRSGQRKVRGAYAYGVSALPPLPLSWSSDSQRFFPLRCKHRQPVPRE